MPGHARIIGIHRVEADEPVHLVELAAEGDIEEFDMDQVTQEVVGQPRENWQAPYDDQRIEDSVEKVRYAFFFHCLDLKQPLLTSFGPLPIPKPTKVPAHLQDIEYEAP